MIKKRAFNALIIIALFSLTACSVVPTNQQPVVNLNSTIKTNTNYIAFIDHTKKLRVVDKQKNETILPDVIDICLVNRDWFAVKKDGTLWQFNYAEGKLRKIKGLSRVKDVVGSKIDNITILFRNGRVGNMIMKKNKWEIRKIRSIKDITKLASNSSSTFDLKIALKKDGTVWSWGMGAYGGLGNGLNKNSSIPVRVKGLKDVSDITVGWGTVFALLKDGTVWGWGYNKQNQLGNNGLKFVNKPIMLSGLTDVKKISVGVTQVLALKNDNTLWSWGYDKLDTPEYYEFLNKRSDNLKDLTSEPRKINLNIGVIVDCFADASGWNAFRTKDGSLYLWGIYKNKIQSLERMEEFSY